MLNKKGEEVGIIYGWYCTVTDKWYIGQTVRPEYRFKSHIILSENNDKSYFHKALRKYPLENWVYCVLEENILRENLNMKEQEWIEYYDSFYCGYNLTTGGDTNCIFSEEVKRKISESCKGSKNGMYGKPAPNRKKVIKYDLNGNFIKEYYCIKDAIKENPKAGNLKDVCKGLRKQAGGFIWKYAS